MNLFKVTTPKLSMNRNVIIALIILGGITSSGLAYAVTNGSITTGNLTVTGTCSGCGGGSGSFNSWSSVLNGTVSGSHASTVIGLQLSNNGTVTGLDLQKASIVKVDGTVLANIAVSESFESDQRVTSQSTNGQYLITLGSDNNLSIFKNDALFKTYSINPAQFSAMSTVSIIMSPSGKYIAIYGEDTGAALERLVILQGS